MNSIDILLGITVYLLIGTVAGLLAGMLGVGGGLIIVPALVWVLPYFGVGAEHLMQVATACSLATITLTGIASARAHQARGAVQWPVVRSLAPTLAVGAWLSGYIAGQLRSETLSLTFCLFVMALAFNMARTGSAKKPSSDPLAPTSNGAILAGVGLVIGLLSGLVGIGGGSLIVPLLTQLRWTMTQAVATSAACGVPIALFGALGYVQSGWHISMPGFSSGFVYWPAVLGISAASWFAAPQGAHWAHRLPAARLKKVFAVFLFLVALLMLWQQRHAWLTL